jgi:hypothetical protein
MSTSETKKISSEYKEILSRVLSGKRMRTYWSHPIGNGTLLLHNQAPIQTSEAGKKKYAGLETLYVSVAETARTLFTISEQQDGTLKEELLSEDKQHLELLAAHLAELKQYAKKI